MRARRRADADERATATSARARARALRRRAPDRAPSSSSTTGASSDQRTASQMATGIRNAVAVSTTHTSDEERRRTE